MWGLVDGDGAGGHFEDIVTFETGYGASTTATGDSSNVPTSNTSELSAGSLALLVGSKPKSMFVSKKRKVISEVPSCLATDVRYIVFRIKTLIS
jgi:hypothetical protein